MPGQIGAAVKAARRAAPLARQAYQRWQSLTPEEKERYARIMREYGERARGAYEGARGGKRRR
ncbi:MAG: hypothetical protein QOD53_1409 [Thermoleophilaceae bacterium]|jgi:hypothetical protein|nr:hypothetical protein [Thermoleophilaceae bacterium]